MNFLERRVWLGKLVLGTSFICCFAPLAALLLALVRLSFVNFDSTNEFTALSGPDARSRLGGEWPDGIDPPLIDSVDYKSSGSIDSGSTWFKIRCTPAAASEWTKKMRDDELGWAAFCRTLNSNPEGIDRVIHGKPDLRRPTGPPPDWWDPPSIDFQATEIMLWYKTDPSGVARCIYSGFDSLTQTLWIYHYICQHDRMWTRGSPPKGNRIDFDQVP
jgi:hypothetical protein